MNDSAQPREAAEASAPMTAYKAPRDKAPVVTNLIFHFALLIKYGYVQETLRPVVACVIDPQSGPGLSQKINFGCKLTESIVLASRMRPFRNVDLQGLHLQ